MGKQASRKQAKKTTKYLSHNKRKGTNRFQKVTASEISWDGLSYFILHNLLAAIFMYPVTFLFFSTIQSDSWSWITSAFFWVFTGYFIAASVGMDLVSRVIIFALINYTYKSSSKRTKKRKIKVMKGFWSFQKGINALDFDWVLATYVSALMYLIGFYVLLSSLFLFEINPFAMFIFTWATFKIIVAVIVFVLLKKNPARRIWFFIIVNVFIILSIFFINTIAIIE